MTNLKLALRTLFRSPFVTTVAILSLSLGIGANAAMFGVIDHVGRASCSVGGQTVEGWGLFEHGALGRHDPSGFADWLTLAP